MAFQQGLSGLNASSRNLEVIGHNIANANTVGMKTSRAEFAELYASAYNAAGGGVTVATVSQQFKPGDISVTGNDLDLAIAGYGFFELTLPSGGTGYTRAGMFKLNAEGEIVTNDGAHLMGYPTDDNGLREGFETKALNLPAGNLIPANQTTAIVADFNLDARAEIAADAVPPTPLGTYGTSIIGFDAQGLEIPIGLAFEKIGNNQWNVYSSVNGADPALSVPFQINFLADGTLDPATVVPDIQMQSPNDPAVVFNATLDFDAATQFGAAFSVADLQQDGYRPGELLSIKFNDSGVITASYSNGEDRAAGQVALVNFRNPQGLQPIGEGNWQAEASAGDPIHGVPGEGNFGTVRSGALENSNVDLTAELVSMMTAQRAYQANAQTIKTQDQVLNTLLNMK